MYRLTTDTFTLNLIEFVSFLRVLLGQKSGYGVGKSTGMLSDVHKGLIGSVSGGASGLNLGLKSC